MNLAIEQATEVVEGKPFHVPPAGELFNYKPFACVAGDMHPSGAFCESGFAITFPVLMMFGITLILMLFFINAFRKAEVVPRGAQNVGEAMVDFVRNQIVLPVIGPGGAGWTPFLTIMFFWVLFMNLMGIVPGVQFPLTSRMAFPALLAALAWLIYNGLGIKNQGFGGYFRNMMFPPGVPKPIYILLAPIELISTVIVRPLTLAVRLFANMVAGHMILAVLFLGTATFFASGLGKVTFLLPFALATVLTGFEVFVAGMQAFIITILTAVYIAGAQEAHH